MVGDSPFVSISPLHLEREAQGRIHSISHWHLPTGELAMGSALTQHGGMKVAVKTRDCNGITSGGEKICCVYGTV